MIIPPMVSVLFVNVHNHVAAVKGGPTASTTTARQCRPLAASSHS